MVIANSEVDTQMVTQGSQVVRILFTMVRGAFYLKTVSKIREQGVSSVCIKYHPPYLGKVPHGQMSLYFADLVGVELLLCSCSGSTKQQEPFIKRNSFLAKIVPIQSCRAIGTRVLVVEDALTHLGFSPQSATASRMPPLPITTFSKERATLLMKSLSSRELSLPAPWDCPTRNRTSATSAVLHTEGEEGQKSPSHELDSMILMRPFQLGTLYDSMISPHNAAARKETLHVNT